MSAGKVVGHCKRKKKTKREKKSCFPQRTKQTNDRFTRSPRILGAQRKVGDLHNVLMSEGASDWSTINGPSRETSNIHFSKLLEQVFFNTFPSCFLWNVFQAGSPQSDRILKLLICLFPVSRWAKSQLSFVLRCKDSQQRHSITSFQSEESLCPRRNVAGADEE